MTEKPDDILTHLPAKLKEARTQKGLSLDAIAKLSGDSVTAKEAAASIVTREALVEEAVE